MTADPSLPVPEPVAPSPRSPEADLAHIAQLYLNHFHTGRTVATSPAMLTDTRTMLDDVRRVLYSVEQPATDTERLIFLIHQGETLVSDISGLQAAIATLTADASFCLLFALGVGLGVAVRWPYEWRT